MIFFNVPSEANTETNTENYFLSILNHDNILLNTEDLYFLEIDTYKALNFDDQTWLKSIVKLCLFASINKVVIFRFC